MISNLPAILMVEGDLATEELYSQVIRDEFTVLTCNNEAQVIEEIRNNTIVAVILEPALLGGRGWALIPIIQKELGTRSVPLILCSVLGDRKRGVEMGASFFLVKPVLPITLLNVLHRAISSTKDYTEDLEIN